MCIPSAPNIEKRLQRIAKYRGYKLNPDLNRRKMIIDGLVQNAITKGASYCPCKIVTGDEYEDCKNICPCDDLETTGKCKCKLFLTDEPELGFC
jgi:ferredoxin-thioredoxin reductase catalytic chain